MKYFKRLKLYKSNECLYNPETMEATSYNWWVFIKLINGVLVFNNYNYSPSTIKHQYKVRDLLRELEIDIDITIEAPKGLQDLNSAIAHYDYLIKELNDAIAKPRSQKKKNLERQKQILELEVTKSKVKGLKLKVATS